MVDEVKITIFRRQELGPTFFGPDSRAIFPRGPGSIIVGDDDHGPTIVNTSLTIDELKSRLPPGYQKTQLKDANGNRYDDDGLYDMTLLEVVRLYYGDDAELTELKLYITLPRRAKFLQEGLEKDFEDNKNKKQQTFHTEDENGENGIYKKMGHLGAGGQATVFRCQTSDKQYAVKMFRQSVLEDNTAQRVALNNELKILKALHGHPRIVNVADHYENDLHFFVVMDLLKFGDLCDAVHSTVYVTDTVDEMAQTEWHHALKENDARYIFWQLLDAVTFIHSKRVLHRDIKPENILVSNVQSHGVRHYYDVKIADFGLSKLIPGPAPETVSTESDVIPAPVSLLRTTTVVGTPGYVPPEMAFTESGVVYDEKVDYWCLGETLYFLVTGILPFDPDGNELRSCLQEAAENPLEKSPRWETLSEDAKDLISGLLTTGRAEQLPGDKYKIDCSTRYGKEQCLTHKWITQGGQEVAFPMTTHPDNIPLSRVPTPSSEGNPLSVEILTPQLVSECRAVLCLEELLRLSDIQVEVVAAWEDARKKLDDLVNGIADMIANMKKASNRFLQKFLPNIYRLLNETIWLRARQTELQGQKNRFHWGGFKRRQEGDS